MNFMRKCEDGEYSSLVGWIIGLGKKLRESNGRVQQLREELQSSSNWMVSRNVTSWAPTHWDQENWLAIKMLYMYIYICNNDWLPHGYVLSWVLWLPIKKCYCATCLWKTSYMQWLLDWFSKQKGSHVKFYSASNVAKLPLANSTACMHTKGHLSKLKVSGWIQIWN